MGEFTEKQMAVGKEEFERRLQGLREYAYSDAHPVLTRSIVWEVAYVDSVLAEVERLRTALQALYDATDTASLGMRHCAALGGCPDWNDDAKKVDDARETAGRLLGGGNVGRQSDD